ncbi:adenosine deaminase [Holotrichia oblita]|uniref:Adenosine deaminase n=1 Tax=Holotrichia oblita TaxID=644536 RepID=A0ACB9TKP1_HOLOL|nr:adenosine deaminase [Holotrichia oblita]
MRLLVGQLVSVLALLMLACHLLGSLSMLLLEGIIRKAAVQVLMVRSSSSSSEEEENEPILNQLIVELHQHRQKNELFLENVVPNYTAAVFREHFRVEREMLRDLGITFMESEWYPKTETRFDKLSAEHSLWIFCWFASHEAVGFRDVADRFNIAISTLPLLIFNVSHFLSNLSPTVIKWPTENEQDEISRDFVQMGFVERVIGCVDGVHFRIERPVNDADSYYNRKKYFSIQALDRSKNLLCRYYFLHLNYDNG